MKSKDFFYVRPRQMFMKDQLDSFINNLPYLNYIINLFCYFVFILVIISIYSER